MTSNSIPTQAATVMGLPRALRDKQLHVVMGKGGVGRSTVALSLALGLWKSGKKVLLCQLNTPDAHGPLLGIEVGPELVVARPGMTLVNIEPKAARREYVMLILKFKRVYDAIFENRFVTYFLRFVPSLAELNVIGKVWFHAEQQENNARRFDAIVLDAPATGHGITIMRLARVLSETAPAGPMRNQTMEMATLFEDARRTALHVVTTPDELSVLETEELVARIRKEKVGPLGAAFLNRAPETLFTPGQAEPLRTLLPDPALGQVARVALERAQLEASSRAAHERLTSLGMPVITLPEMPSERFTFQDSEELAGRILPAVTRVEALS